MGTIFGYTIVGVFAFFALLLSGGSRLENSMDEVLCGKRMANHKVSSYDKWAIFCLILELIFDIILNQK